MKRNQVVCYACNNIKPRYRNIIRHNNIKPRGTIPRHQWNEIKLSVTHATISSPDIVILFDTTISSPEVQYQAPMKRNQVVCYACNNIKPRYRKIIRHNNIKPRGTIPGPNETKSSCALRDNNIKPRYRNIILHNNIKPRGHNTKSQWNEYNTSTIPGPNETKSSCLLRRQQYQAPIS